MRKRVREALSDDASSLCLVREFALSVLAPSKGLVSSECLASSQGALMTSYTDSSLRGEINCRV